MKTSPAVAAVSIVGIMLAALGFYFGSLLPFLKGRSYIAAERRMAYVRSVDDFKANYDTVFNLYSPVGDEEIAKFLGNNVVNIIAQNQPEEVSRQLVAYIEPRLFKDDVRHLLLLAQMHELLWNDYRAEADYQKAADYLEEAHRIGPNLPPPLYKLLNLYALGGDKENFERIGRIILSNWPEDANVSALFNQTNAT